MGRRATARASCSALSTVTAGVAVDKTGNIIVVELGNHRVQVFDEAGWVLVFGREGSGKGEM